MGLARTLAVALTGLEGHLVEVECDISAGLPGLAYTGRADASVVESRDRLRAAVHNSGADWPKLKITVALLPADVPKAGSRFDLAICMALLAADEQVPLTAVEQVVWISELGLDGRLRPVRGVLPSVLAASRRGVRRVVVARSNAAEAALIADVEVRAAECLADIVAWLTGQGPPLPVAVPQEPTKSQWAAPDLIDVAGQAAAKRAVEIAAAGSHHLYLVGAAGAGKTMLAERLPGVLPALDDAASLEVTPCTPSPDSSGNTPTWSAALRSRRRTTPPRSPRWSAAAHIWRGRAPSAWPITECCSSTRPRSSPPAHSTRCASRWRTATSSCIAAAGRCVTPHGSNSSWRPTRVRARSARATAPVRRPPGTATPSACPAR
jgi:predicted ATPase with chaperone activity